MNYKNSLYDVYDHTDLSLKSLEDYKITYKHYYHKLLPKDLQSMILDIGCGFGAFLYFLHSEFYENVEGVDFNLKQIKKAREFGINNVIYEDAVTFLNEHPETYDCVVATDLIDHFPKDQAYHLLEAIFRSLSVGGRVILQAVNADGPFFGRLRYGDFTHEFALTRTSAEQLLRATGFKEISIYGMEPFAHSFASLIRAVVWKLIKTFLWVYLVAETGEVRGHIFTKNLIAMGIK